MGRAVSALIVASVFCAMCLSQQDKKTSQQPASATQPAPEPHSPKASDGMAAFDVGKFPIGVVSDGTNIWVANDGGTVTKLRASDGTVLETFAVGKFLIGIVFDGMNIWVADGESNNLMAAGVCLYCLRHPALQWQYASRLAIKLKGVETPANHAGIAGIRRCALNSRCLRAETRKGYPVGGRGLYFSSACLGRAKAIAKAKPAAVMVEV